ncbi:hypothetical protein KVF93_05875 [Streptococcus equi subsp. zooepidemicus]|uniref:hypothetical protein n=1 Tax=Streptococcus equi TaxID=1336 RepID=UPI0010CAC554|nr:hypothetical protein [Streptococcus equi]MCD3376855.1 hypothetical protein [Streptococcus equi subsp. zooepidemicus]MCD3411606.1 hypothetical protein [Streptococcus equi subsp. zooepidemicus]MCD3453827.1 hypothetical protein [Streptococcus equi subsp. zooepidemicus]MDI6076300.1 hypothetical protein [Streptococcus equi subsp. zooepidemicus]VTS41032.1 phage protein [Streptococcus equi subsp. zooepidemicus]
MTLKTFSDTAQTFTFTYDFEDIDTAKVASHAVLGYMTGTYHAPVIEATIKGKGQLVLEYVEDKKLNKVFKRICDGFKDYYNNPEAETDIEKQYRLERVEQLKQSEDFDSLLNKVVAYELELLDYAERLLSDEPIPMDFMTAYGTLDLIGTEGVELLKSLDEDDEYSGLADYKADTE